MLPDDSPYITTAFCVALEIVWCRLQAISPLLYQLAVYNLATSNIFNYAQDPSPIVPAPPPASQTVGYFAWFRQQWGLLSFVSGVVQSTSDQGTSESLLVPDFMSQLTLANLRNLKDPYGQTYLQIMQSMGGYWGSTP